MTVPAKQHNARQGDDTNYNFYLGGCTHMTISLPLPGTRNYISNNFSSELDRQIFWERFCSLAVVAYIVLRFWGTRGRGWLFWERSNWAHLPHVPGDQWKILVIKCHLLSWCCNRKFPIRCLNCLQEDLHLCLCYTSLPFRSSLVLCGPLPSAGTTSAMARLWIQTRAQHRAAEAAPSAPQQSPDVKEHICRAADDWACSFLS